MARGQKQAADKQLGITNSIGADERKRQQGLEDKLIPGYTSLMNTGYMSPDEEHAATTSEMGAATEPFESAGFEASARAGRTRNASDLTAQQDQLALDKGREAGHAAEGLQHEKMQNELAGMYGLSNLRGEDLQSMGEMYGMGPATLKARGTSSFGVNTPWGGVSTSSGT